MSRIWLKIITESINEWACTVFSSAIDPKSEDMLKTLSSKAVPDENRRLLFKVKGKNATKLQAYHNSDFTLFPTVLQKRFSSG